MDLIPVPITKARGEDGRDVDIGMGNASPATFIVGKDSLGRPIEAVDCPYDEKIEMVDVQGNQLWVPLACGRAYNPSQAARIYAERTLRERIEDGFLPVDECPYTAKYTHVVKGPLATPPAGVSDCGGKKGGCEHLLAIRDARREAVRAVVERGATEALAADLARTFNQAAASAIQGSQSRAGDAPPVAHKRKDANA